MADTQSGNAKVIEGFRANGGDFNGMPLLLLHSTGAKSGQERVHPIMYQLADNAYAVFASKAGAPTNPDWYYNLLAHPDATIEIGAQTKAVRARVTQGDERNSLWTKQKELYPDFADYEHRTSRKIPVVILEPVD